MFIVRALHRLFLLAALLGVLLAPVSNLAAEAAMASLVNTSDTSMAGMSMPDEMPCCPKPKPVSKDCMKGCPFALSCTTKLVGGDVSQPARPTAPERVKPIYLMAAFATLSSTTDSPPHRPPRT